jgi:hypothetical protein
MLETGRILTNLSFGSFSSILYTNIGTIDLQSVEDFSADKIPRPAHPRYTAIGLSSDSKWIMHEGDNVLLVPSKCPLSYSSVRGKRIGIGVASGSVWFCSISF